MPASVKQLRLPDFVFNRKGSVVFRLLLAAFGITLRLFFRRIETVNADRVPVTGGLIFVLNHPNGLIDPALVFVALPSRISFLAKSTLFRMPVISYILKTVEALPVYRKVDEGEDVAKNQLTFDAARRILQKGGSIALFPEGISHNSPKLLPAKTGAARIALGAAAKRAGAEPIRPMIVPVGLFYTSKTTFRSEALLHFGEPFEVPLVETDADGDLPRESVRRLTSEIENALREVTLNAESDAVLQTARIAEEVFSASSENEYLGDKFDFLQTYVSRVDPQFSHADRNLEAKLIEYDRKLERRGIEPVHLSLSQFSRGFVVRQAILRSWYLLLLAPFAVAGALLHFPAYQLCRLLAHYYTHHGADDIVSTVKVLAAMVFMPLTWIAAAAAIYFFFGWQVALVSIPLSITLGYVALYASERTAELAGWARAIRLYLTEKEAFLRLFAERKKLTEQLREMEVG